MTAIHQFVHSFVDHDAVSSHVRNLRRIIQEMGIESNIYASEWRGELSKATHFANYQNSSPENTKLLYHFATESPMVEFLSARPEQVVMNYHNLTPSELLAPWEPLIGAEVDRARLQLDEFAPYVKHAIAASRFSEIELTQAGYKNAVVAPVLFDTEDFERAPDKKTDVRLQQAKKLGGVDWLFVGRIAPHKCQHDVVRAFALYQRLYDPDARLHLVGGISSHLYLTTLRKYINVLGVKNSVFITERVSSGALVAYYKNADVFVGLSEHEGFGVPLLEALHNKVPAIAYAVTAVPETLGDGGLLIEDKSASFVAAAVHRLMVDSSLRTALVAKGTSWLNEFSKEKNEARWRELIEKMER